MTTSLQPLSSQAQDTSLKRASVRRVGANVGYKPLALIVLLGLVPRFYWMATQTPVISLDGSEYVRMAENLASGKGLIGNFPGFETMYTPLLSVLTAGFDLVTRNAELAAHLICVIFGAALIIPVFFIARRMYGLRVAYLAAVLVAVHPLLIALSGSIYNENVYLTLLLVGVYFGMRSLEYRKNRDYVLLGLFLSLAYLTRPEAFAYPIFFVLAIWVSVIIARVSVRRAALGSALILGIFILFASPYIAFLDRHTGHVRLEGKWDINYTIANRIRSGMNYPEASYGLGQDASIAGPLLDPFRFASYTSYSNSLASKMETLLAMAKVNRQQVPGIMRDGAIGGPILFALMLIGLFRKSWSPRRLFHETILICMVISVLFLMATASDAEFRYVLPFVALSIIWVAKGIDEVGQWTRSLASSLQWQLLPKSRSMGLLAQMMLLLLFLGVALRGTRMNGMFLSEQARYADLKHAGLWLENLRPGPKRIACMGTIPTYYAQGTIIGLPYANSSQALRYFELNKVDFIVLDCHYSLVLPEVAQWMKYGIPDSRARLIYKTGADASNGIEIYRWERSPRSL